MYTCYWCGRKIPKGQKTHRLLVKTGEDRLRPLQGDSSQRIRTTYGKRILCTGCAQWREANQRRTEGLDLALQGAFIVCFLMLACLTLLFWG